jgi:hypothetical protein
LTMPLRLPAGMSAPSKSRIWPYSSCSDS